MLLVGVSGGIDSMYLAEKVRLSGGPFAIAHCNFSLRGAESDGDEEFVRRWACTYGIELHVRRFDTHEAASSMGISLEMAARQLRYRWFGELCRENGYEAVLVAHNANDNAETLLLNLLRGTGLKGILGMRKEGFLPDPAFRDIPLRRPLLGTLREEIEAYMQEHRLPYREDSTNRENHFKRNKLRNQVFPIFRDINPSFIQTLNRDMERFGEELFPRTEEKKKPSEGHLSGQYTLREEPWDGTGVLAQPRGSSIVDADRIAGAPLIGQWQDGDWIRPIGAPGRKKLQDWFTDRHFPLPDKHRIPLLRDPSDPSHVLAILGYAVDKSVMVGKRTRRIYRFQLLDNQR